MDWSIIEKITNHPVFIALAVIVPLLAGAATIFKQSSLGKKAIESLTNLVDKNACRVIDIKKDVENVREDFNYVKESVLNFQSQIATEVKTYFSQLEFFETGIYNILSQIPNAKVQAELKVFYSQWQDKKKQIQEYVGGSFVELDEKIKEIDESKNHEIDTLRNEIESLKELVTKLSNSLENGENEEQNAGTNN